MNNFSLFFFIPNLLLPPAYHICLKESQTRFTVKCTFLNETSYNKRSRIPEAPPVPEEPTEQIPRGNLVCQICSKVFKTHSQLDRHFEHEHGTPEKTHLEKHP
jgi:hypothetical protein